MSEAAFALAGNRLQNSSGINENPSAPNTLDQLLLREGYADRIAATLKQRRDSELYDIDVSERTIEVRPIATGAGFDVDVIIDFPDLAQISRPVPQVSFHLLQEWEGHVTEIGEDDFTVRLLDLTAGSSHEEEEAVIPISEISEDDLKRLRLGSIFRWVIGYERSASGTKQRVSRIVFRELPVVTKQDIAEAEERARKTAQLWARTKLPLSALVTENAYFFI